MEKNAKIFASANSKKKLAPKKIAPAPPAYTLFRICKPTKDNGNNEHKPQTNEAIANKVPRKA